MSASLPWGERTDHIQGERTKRGWNTWRMKIQMRNIWTEAPIARGERERERCQFVWWSSTESLSKSKDSEEWYTLAAYADVYNKLMFFFFSIYCLYLIEDSSERQKTRADRAPSLVVCRTGLKPRTLQLQLHNMQLIQNCGATTGDWWWLLSLCERSH